MSEPLRVYPYQRPWWRSEDYSRKSGVNPCRRARVEALKRKHPGGSRGVAGGRPNDPKHMDLGSLVAA